MKTGHTQIAVARQLVVAKSTVSGWAKRVGRGGLRALHAHGLRGRPASLGERERTRMKRGLRKGALAAGFATELWTLPRVAEWVEHALERDEVAIRRRKQQRWPALKITPKSSTG